MRRSAALALCSVLLAFAPAARAFPRGAGEIELGLELVRYDDGADRGELEARATPGLDLTALIAPGSLPIAYAAGLGYRFGLTLPAGFAHSAKLAPLGLGALVDGLGYFAISAGGGLSGVSEQVPTSLELITQARLFVSLPGPLALTAGLDLAWLRDESRRSGSRLTPADEARALLGLRIGKERSRWDLELGSGALVALAAHEWLGQRGLGVVLGWSIDAIPAVSER